MTLVGQWPRQKDVSFSFRKGIASFDVLSGWRRPADFYGAAQMHIMFEGLGDDLSQTAYLCSRDCVWDSMPSRLLLNSQWGSSYSFKSKNSPSSKRYFFVKQMTLAAALRDMIDLVGNPHNASFPTPHNILEFNAGLVPVFEKGPKIPAPSYSTFQWAQVL
jgi:hypothetical protein